MKVVNAGSRFKSMSRVLTRGGSTPVATAVVAAQVDATPATQGPPAAEDELPQNGPSIAAGLRERLADTGKLSGADFNRALRMSQESHGEQPLARLLVSLGLVAERDLAEAMAELTGMPLATEEDYADMAQSAERVSARFLRETLVFPAAGEDGSVRLVMQDPCDEPAREAMRFAFDRPVVSVIGLRSDIERAINDAYGDGGESAGDGEGRDVEALDAGNFDVEQLKDMASEAPVIRLVNQLLQRASDAGASDIHIEPFEGRLKVRYRIDGVLHDVESPPVSMAPAVISRVKIMARLDIAERRLPQDGRIKLRLHGRDIDARVSTIPTMHGESVVMRLLNRSDVALDLSRLGFAPAVQDKFLDVLRMPHGMILVTGPTGSGKTTTLYTAIHILNTEDRKIITAEDPVEYQMEGVNQIQVKPAIGLTFANVLRSIVRQDPDVILVGEMRDLETARICVQSSLTGHLVLSTLHTNSAASSVTRLLEMGIEDYLLASTLNAVVSQRLVRVLCPHCREQYEPAARLVQELGLERFVDGGEVLLYRSRGCEHCNGTGFQGRHAIMEMLVMNEELRSLVLGRKDARQLEAAALRTGMRSIYEDGCRKALAGVTAIEEVMRVIQEV
ncbi:MAG: type II secretion system ATPase GspE [Gammaproteobacteria bacterium]|nr:type II secretion system ATPase GspE [Gammaproteobacteria bacterium]MDH4256522.1 type II secretion system ATPase GspE [Gammaproteobacteria bacterium]MDH5311260.1 type II secretion system ATPase GspE [Gammaproteobacteria bacterium]